MKEFDSDVRVRGAGISTARIRGREEMVPAEIDPEEELQGIILELNEHYKIITGKQIAPSETLKHLAQSDVQIFGEQSAESQESHARDALEMSRLAPDELKLPMLFHDIGKAGPDYDNAPLSKLVAKMYAYNFPYRDLGKTPHDTSIQEFLEAMIEQEPQLAKAPQEAKNDFVAKLQNMLHLKDGAVMRDFYDAHIRWGVELQEKHNFVDKPTAFAAFGHHILPGIMPRDMEAIQHGEKKMGKGIVPVVRNFTPLPIDIKLAAGAQTLDFCNARFTRSKDGVDAAVEQTKEALFFAIDNGGYDNLIEQYKQHGVEIALSTDDIAEIKAYILQILETYRQAIREHKGV